MRAHVALFAIAAATIILGGMFGVAVVRAIGLVLLGAAIVPARKEGGDE